MIPALQSNTTFLIPIIVFVAIVSIVFAARYYGKKQRILRQLKKFKLSKIAKIQSHQLTKITGKTLHVHEPLVAPFSKRKCVAYHITIERRRNTGNSRYWRTIVRDEQIQDFFLKQGDEVVMIKPTTAPKNYSSYMVIDSSVRSGFLNNPSTDFESVLRRYKVDSKNFLGMNKTLRYSERIIEVGEEITVGGIAKWKTMSEPMPGLNYSRIATLESSNTQKLIITDLPEARPKEREFLN